MLHFNSYPPKKEEEHHGKIRTSNQVHLVLWRLTPALSIFLGLPGSGGILSSGHIGMWTGLCQKEHMSSICPHPLAVLLILFPFHTFLTLRVCYYSKNPIKVYAQGKEGREWLRRQLACNFWSFFCARIWGQYEEHDTYPFFVSLICCILQISVKNDLHGLSVPAQGSMMQSSPAIVVTAQERRKGACIHSLDRWNADQHANPFER